MMANHISGEEPWELFVRGARAAGWVIMAVGCPTCVTDEAPHAHLPEDLQQNVALVANATDLDTRGCPGRRPILREESQVSPGQRFSTSYRDLVTSASVPSAGLKPPHTGGTR